MVFAPIQAVALTDQLVPVTVTIAPARPGSLLVVGAGMRGAGTSQLPSDNVSGTTGWVLHPLGSMVNSDQAGMAYKIALGGETTITARNSRNDRNRACVIEFPLAGAVLADQAENSGNVAGVLCGSLTAARGPALWVGTAAVAVSDSGSQSFSSAYAEADDGKVGPSFHPLCGTWWHYLEAADGVAVNLGGTCSQTGRLYAAQALLFLGAPTKGFPGEPGGGVW